MELVLMAKGTGGHTEAVFAKDEIRISFVKTDPKERGMIETMVEKAKKEGMKLHTADKDGKLTEIDDATLVDKIFKSKGELILKGSVATVKKLALDIVEKEILERSLVTEAQTDGSWKIIKEGEFKDKEEKQVVQSSKVPGGG